MSRGALASRPDTALNPLNDDWKFFLAHLPFTAQPQDIREHFSKFGTVNFVKLVFDKLGKSKGYGFLYMNDPQGDAAVEEYAAAHNNRIHLLNKSGVFLNRNDRRRQNPIRKAGKMSHDDGIMLTNPSNIGSSRPLHHVPASNYYGDSYSQGDGGYPAQETYGVNTGSSYPPPLVAPHYDSHVPVPPYEQYSYAPNNPHFQPDGYISNVPPPQAPPFQSFQLSTKVLLENLPLTATTEDICVCLSQYSLSVIRCSMEYDQDPKASWCYAHIDFSNSEESSRCVALAQQSLLEYRGRILTASIDNSISSPATIPQAVAAMNNQLPPAPYHNVPPYNHSQQVPPNVGYSRTLPRDGPRHQSFRRGGGRGGGRGRQKRRDRPY